MRARDNLKSVPLLWLAHDGNCIEDNAIIFTDCHIVVSNMNKKRKISLFLRDSH